MLKNLQSIKTLCTFVENSKVNDCCVRGSYMKIYKALMSKWVLALPTESWRLFFLSYERFNFNCVKLDIFR